MLKEESAYYSEEFWETLRDGYNESACIPRFNGALYGIYEDRGIADYKNRICDLCLPDDMKERMHFFWIENSCHMPMIENAPELSNVIFPKIS